VTARRAPSSARLLGVALGLAVALVLPLLAAAQVAPAEADGLAIGPGPKDGGVGSPADVARGAHGAAAATVALAPLALPPPREPGRVPPPVADATRRPAARAAAEARLL
jgi:hypothetical protein